MTLIRAKLRSNEILDAQPCHKVYVSKYLERIKKGNEMNKYRFDWKDVIHGSIEITANCGKDAEEVLMSMSLRELLENSQHNSDKQEREIRFADAGQHFQSLDQDDWNNLKENL